MDWKIPAWQPLHQYVIHKEIQDFFVQYLQADIIDASNLAMCEVHSDPSDCTLSPFVIGECQMTLLNSSGQRLSGEAEPPPNIDSLIPGWRSKLDRASLLFSFTYKVGARRIVH